MTKGKVLVIGSSADRLDVRGGCAETGQYLNELVVPARALIEAGYHLELATPTGRKPAIDANSDSADHFDGDAQAYREARSFYESDPSMNAVRSLRQVLDGGLDGFAGVFVPGGHGPVADLMQDEETGAILRAFHAAGKPTALLCHGPAALASAVRDPRAFRKALIEGDIDRARELAAEWPYAGYEMTVFSASEEAVAERQVLHADMLFIMPDVLRAAGGEVFTGPDFEPNVIVDRELITGQNPRSDHQLAAKLIDALEHFSISKRHSLPR